MLRTFLLMVTLLAAPLIAGCGENNAPSDESVETSVISADEQVVFFRTSGWLDEVAQEWHLPIHAWVYEPQDSSVRKALLETALDEQFDLSPTSATQGNLDSRVNLLIADNERGKTLVVHIAGRDFELPPTAANGQVETTLRIPVREIDKFGAGDFINFTAVFAEGDDRRAEGEIRLVEASGISVISDIDDTVKISNVTDRKQLLESTFLLDFEAASGMASKYKEWAKGGVSFHYVSSSPWQLYAPLVELLDAEQFPWATLSLKAVRFRDKSLLNLFKKGTETKPIAIEKILAAYPARSFVLVGDSGEQDPEVYAELLRKFPEQITNIFIRNVSEETKDNERFTAVFAGIAAERWSLFTDPAGLTLSTTADD